MKIIPYARRKITAATYHADQAWTRCARRIQDAYLRRAIRGSHRDAVARGAVALGMSYNATSGVRNHLKALAQFCDAPTWLLPDDGLIPRLATSRSRTIMRNELERLGLRQLPTIHSHVDPWFIKQAAAAARNGARWVHTYHTLYFPEDWPDGLAAWQEETNASLVTVAAEAHRRISVSQWLRDHLLEEYGIETEFIPNGYDDLACQATKARTSVDAGATAGHVIYAGGVSAVKNPEAFLDLAGALPDTAFSMAGPSVTVRSVEALGRGLPSNVQVLGHLPHHRLLEAIASASALVLTSRSEGTPTLLLEALALGCPVIAVDGRGTREVLADGRYGWLCPGDDTERLAECVVAASGDSARSKRAEDEIPEKYGWSRLSPQIDRIYRDELR